LVDGPPLGVLGGGEAAEGMSGVGRHLTPVGVKRQPVHRMACTWLLSRVRSPPAPTCPVSDLFGRAPVLALPTAAAQRERRSAEALIRQLDFLGAELKAVDGELAVEALGDPVVARLMTIPGIDSVVALSIVSAVGDFARFPSPDIVSHLGLNPKVRQSGESNL
jgi:Transposase IS116/IS110/IS902 family